MDSPDDLAQRAHLAIESYLARRRELEQALRDIAVLKHTLRALAEELEPRMEGIEGRLIVLGRTVGHLLAELDRGHTTAITRLRRAEAAEVPTDPHVETTRIEKPTDP